MEKVDVNEYGINEKLATKYNSIVNFIKEGTLYVDGCINDSIGNVEYIREKNPDKVFETKDYIKITTTTFNKVLWINNPKALRIDRKYNMIIKVDKLEI